MNAHTPAYSRPGRIAVAITAIGRRATMYTMMGVGFDGWTVQNRDRSRRVAGPRKRIRKA